MLPIYHYSRIVTLAEIREAKKTKLENGWISSPPISFPDFVLAFDQENIFFSFSAYQKPWHNNEKQDSFIEGLWQFDVAELFLKDEVSNSYQEFNLSPSGAWWSQVFDDYRKPSNKPVPTEPIETFSEIKNKQWHVGIKIPRSAIRINFSFSEKSKANVSAIINTAIGSTIKNYFSFANIPSEKPDFHLSRYFSKCDYLIGND